MCSGSKEAHVVLRTQDFSRGLATTCLKVQRCSVIISGRKWKYVIITLIKADGSSVMLRNF